MLNIDPKVAARRTLAGSLAHLNPDQLVWLYKELAFTALKLRAALDNFIMPEQLDDDNSAAEKYTYGIEPAYLALMGLIEDTEEMRDSAAAEGRRNMGAEEFAAAVR